MKQRIAIATAVVGLGLAATAGGAAADTRLGIEMGRTLAGYPGLGARVDLGPVQLEGLIAGQLVSTDGAPRTIVGALRVLVPFRRWSDGWVGAMAGVDGDNRHIATVPATLDDPITYTPDRMWALEGGVHAEWFALPALSIGLDLGAVYRVGDPYASSNPTYASIGVGGIGGGGTVAFWF